MSNSSDEHINQQKKAPGSNNEVKRRSLINLAKEIPGGRRLTSTEVNHFVIKKFYRRSEDVLTSKEIKQKVRDYFRDIPLMVKIIECESTNRHFVEGKILRGELEPNDIGIAQINLNFHLKESYALGLDPFDFEDNLLYARHLYEKNGSRPWKASRSCWGKTYLALKS